MAKIHLQLNAGRIKWEGRDSTILFDSKRVSQSQMQVIKDSLPNWESHIWLQTSGSQGDEKWVGLSHRALLHSAQVVGDVFAFRAGESVLCALPEYHVGGLAQWARAHVFEQTVRTMAKWDPLEFVSLLKSEKIAWTSLVPTQLYDVVKLNLPCPETLRGLFVGGAALTPSLCFQAMKNRWPLFPSFGMSEAASQIATSSVLTGPLASQQKESTNLEPMLVLPHWQVRTTVEGVLEIQGSALFSGYLSNRDGQWRVVQPFTNGWFTTADRVILSHTKQSLTLDQPSPSSDNQTYLSWQGRSNSLRKVKGEMVSLDRLQSQWQTQNEIPVLFFFVDDERDGAQVAAVLHFDEITNSIPQSIPQPEPDLGHPLASKQWLASSSAVAVARAITKFNESLAITERVQQVFITNATQLKLRAISFDS